MSAGTIEEQVLALTEALIRCPSVTPDDAGCQQILGARLAAQGFELEQIDGHGTANLWAVRPGDGPHLMFAGHTDVVPTGPEQEWHSPPFEPTVRDGHLYGRGAADMKSSLAAMIVAIEQALASRDRLSGTLSLLITSDEEGDATYGTQLAVRELHRRGVLPDYCVVGEPSSSIRVGDVVRCGRRGSLNGRLIVRGIQGHVAYPDDADNPIHAALPALAELCSVSWDQGNDYYPPTSFQISNIHAGTGASNVIPGTLVVDFNFRFNTLQTVEGLQQQVHSLLERHPMTFDLQWQLSGQPFLTERGALTAAVSAAIQAVTSLQTEFSTSGGTSDGRFIAPWCQPGSNRVEVVELGPTNATIHKINECVSISELAPLARMYQGIIETLLT